MLEERAHANGLTLSEWVSDVLLSAPADGAPEVAEIVLAELLALRSLMLNLQYPGRQVAAYTFSKHPGPGSSFRSGKGWAESRLRRSDWTG